MNKNLLIIFRKTKSNLYCLKHRNERFSVIPFEIIKLKKLKTFLFF